MKTITYVKYHLRMTLKLSRYHIKVLKTFSNRKILKGILKKTIISRTIEKTKNNVVKYLIFKGIII